jgi:lipopolysaccharide biosynthesis glycosyltransferase
VRKLYEKNGFVNINEVESTIPNGRAWIKGQKKSKIVNVGSALNTKFVLLAMFTIASIIDSQNLETKLRLHFAVVEGFSVENMIKIYTLRDRIRDDVEFNFYNAKKVEIDLNNTNTKGSSVNAKLIIPELLLDDVERVIILDLGDTLILRDLSEMYNWNMEDKIYYGVLDEGVMKYGRFSKKALDIYINTGCYLVDIKKAKSEKIYEKIVKNKSLYKPSPLIDQDLLNDVAYGKIGYLPIRFGLKAPFTDDKISDSPPYRTDYNNILEKAKYKEKYNLPKNRFEMNSQAINPVVIHQWNGKWICGRGLSIYRRIVQNYIRIAGIWDEICPVFPGVCKK